MNAKTTEKQPLLLFSPQHGATLMAFLPCLYGIWLGTPQWWSVLFLVAWFCAYLLSYPALEYIKGTRKALIRTWIWRYGFLTLIFGVLLLITEPRLIWFNLAVLPFFMVNIYYARIKQERAFVNDLAAIAGFSLVGMAACFYGTGRFDALCWQAGWVPALLFVGSVLHVKSLLRERKNRRYTQLSVLYHIVAPIVLIPINISLALCFVVPALRLLFYFRTNIKPRQIGLAELFISLVFLLLLMILDPRL